jgi:hypothetical protein
MADLLPLEHFVPDLMSLEAYNAMSDAEKTAYETSTIISALKKILDETEKAKGKENKAHYAFLAMKMNLYLKTTIKNSPRYLNTVRNKIKEFRTDPFVQNIPDFVEVMNGVETILNEIDPPTEVNKLEEAVEAKNVEYVKSLSGTKLKELASSSTSLLASFLLASDEMFRILVSSGYKLDGTSINYITILKNKDMDKRQFRDRIQKLFGYPSPITTVGAFINYVLNNSATLDVFQYVVDAMEYPVNDSMLNFQTRPNISEFVLRRLIERKVPLSPTTYTNHVSAAILWILENDPSLYDGYLERVSSNSVITILKYTPKGPFFTQALQYFIGKNMGMRRDVFVYVVSYGTVEDVKLLLEVKGFQDELEYLLSEANREEIKTLLLEAMKRLGKGVWMGWSKGDAEKLDTIFGEDPNKWSVCPICLKYTERKDGCMYMTHDCAELGGFYHKRLYDLYTQMPTQNNENNENNWNENENNEEIPPVFAAQLPPIPPQLPRMPQLPPMPQLPRIPQQGGATTITWCTICNRICKGHQHYELNLAESTTLPKLSRYGDPFERDCRKSNGGGGLPEKIARFRRLREYALELNEDAGKILKTKAMEELVEQMWNAPFYKTRKVQQIEQTKIWNISSNLFPANKANETKEANAPNIPRAAANMDLMPVLAVGEDPITLDEQQVVEFHHRKADGSINLHEGNGISLESFKQFLVRMNKSFGTQEFGYCWNYGSGPEQCTALLHPDEVKKAFELFGEPNEDLVAEYRRQFNKKFQGRVGGYTGGKRKTRKGIKRNKKKRLTRKR